MKKIIIANITMIALFFILTTILLTSPKGETLERKPTFEWFGLPTGYVIMIDDNPEYTTPITAELKGNTYTLEENLGLGDHYWKVKGIRGSNVQTFTITSEVSLKTEEDSLRNDGNTRLSIETMPTITGAAILGINQTIKLEGIEEVSAKQDE